MQRTFKQLLYSVTFIILFCSLSSMIAQMNKDKLDKFKWIIGTWQMPAKNGSIHENWVVLNDSTFQGRSYKVKNTGDSVILESVRLEYKDGSYYYTPTVSGQNDQQPVPFKITSFSASGFIAENPGHDFPQRISYELKGAKELYAFIDGKINGKYIKNEFNYTKVK